MPRSVERCATFRATEPDDPPAVIVAPCVLENVTRRPATSAAATPAGSEKPATGVGVPLTQVHEPALYTYASTATRSAPCGADAVPNPEKSTRRNGFEAPSVAAPSVAPAGS